MDTTSGSEWDLLKYSNLYAGETGNGFITTGTATTNAVVTRRANLTAFSPYTKTVYSPAPLPVTLTHFNVTKLNPNQAKVDWATSSEQNTSHFDIERSLDGVSFIKVGEKTARGGLGQTTEYSFTDNIGSLPNGYVYYRVNRHDFDGSFSYSKTRFILLESEPLSNIIVYPNPAKGEFYVKTPNDTEPFNYTIYNETGQKVLSGLGKNGQAISLDQLSPGLYIMNLSNNGINIKNLNIAVESK